jgi:hypothetical protein
MARTVSPGMTELNRFGTEEVKQLCREIYKRQGYLVMAFTRTTLAKMAEYRPGYKTTSFCQYEINHTFIATEYGKYEDWVMQNELIASLRPDWMLFPAGDANGIFLRMKPEGAKK